MSDGGSPASSDRYSIGNSDDEPASTCDESGINVDIFLNKPTSNRAREFVILKNKVKQPHEVYTSLMNIIAVKNRHISNRHYF